MKKEKKLTWFSLVKWTFSDRNDETYNSEGKSRFYDRIARDFFHRDRLAQFISDTIISLFSKQNPYICERAAGSGIITESLYGNGLDNIRSSDLSESQLLVLQEKLPKIKVAVENFNELMPNVGDDSFDVIFQVGATRFMTKQGQINYIEEAARTLKKNAYLLWPVMWAEIPLAWARVGWNSPRTFSFRIARLLEKNGLEIIKAPILFHGRMFLLTTTFLIIQNKKQPIKRNIFSSLFHLVSKLDFKYLRALKK